MSLSALTHTRSSIIVSDTQAPLEKRSGLVRPAPHGVTAPGPVRFTSCLALLQHIADHNRRLTSHRRLSHIGKADHANVQ